MSVGSRMTRSEGEMNLPGLFDIDDEMPERQQNASSHSTSLHEDDNKAPEVEGVVIEQPDRASAASSSLAALNEELAANRLLEHPLGPVINLLFQGQISSRFGNPILPNYEQLDEALKQADKSMESMVLSQFRQHHEDTYKKVHMQPAGSFNLVVNPPDKYGVHPTLVNNPKQHANRKTYFEAKYKFSGTKQDKVDICDLLRQMTLAQNNCLLSREEFKQALLQQFTTPAFALIAEWIQNGCTVPELYNKIVERFYTKEGPQQALAKLRNIMQHLKEVEFFNLAQAIGEIERLARIASYRYMPGSTRAYFFTGVASEALADILPASVRTPFEAELNRFRGLTGQELTFDQLVNLASAHKVMINGHLDNLRKSKKGENKNGNRVKEVKQGTSKNTGENFRNQNKNSEVDKKKGFGKQKKSDSKDGKTFKKKSLQLGSLPCNLCPSQKHSSVDCNMFPEDQREVVPDVCSRCDWGRNHPEKYCPAKYGKKRQGN